MDTPIDIEKIAEEYDAGIMEADFDSVNGVCMSGPKGYLIAVDKKLDIYQKRWTIAHELGHIKDGTVNSGHSRLSEYRADRNGLDMIIPSDRLMEAIEEYGEDCDFLHCLFGVSIETIQKKVSTL